MGATLSEVLISLAVMSIGVVSLATLFPISVLRSVQATQLTNATNLRYNVEALLSVRPQLYSIGLPWQPGYSYSVGDMVVPTALDAPAIVFQCTTAGTSDKTEPSWNYADQSSTNESTVTWMAYRLQHYVIDPLGNWNVESQYRSTATGNYFGNDGNSPPTVRSLNWLGNTGVRVFGGIGANAVNDNLAADAATLPDSWVTQAESFAVTYAPASPLTCTLNDMQSDLTNTTPYDPSGNYPLSRIVFFDASGRMSDVRPINAIGALTGGTSQSISWPVGNLTITPVRARVETKERRFTWLLSVRRHRTSALMDVVVFFRRPFSGKDEQVYPATFQTGAIDPDNSIPASNHYVHYPSDPGYDNKPGIAGYDDDQNGTVDDASELGAIGSDDVARNWVVVQYNDALGKPSLKKGGFVTDIDSMRWYRIQNIIEGDLVYPSTPTGVMQKAGINTSASFITAAGTTVQPYLPDTMAAGMTNAVLLRLEDKIQENGAPPAGGAGGTPNGGAMLMRGIVDVFPIRTQMTSEN